MTIRMHGVGSFEIIDDQQTKLNNNYRNTKHKLLKTNASGKYYVSNTLYWNRK
jgi:hypothetical protein